MKFQDNIRELRKQKGMSQEELAEKLDVSRQAVSKWENGSGYPELDKLMTICELFHCTMDDLLQGNLRESRVVSREHYDRFHNRQSILTAIGVFMIFCAISSGAFLETVFTGKDEVIIGILFFMFISFAVMLFIYNGLQSESFKKRHPIDPEDIYQQDEIDHFEQTHRFAMMFATGIIIISFALQQLIEYTLNEQIANGIWCIVMGIAVMMFIYFGMQKSKYEQTIPKTEEFKDKEELNKRLGKLCGCIMLVATAIFLLWSFLFDAWRISWIVYPIGGILCGIISILLNKE